MRLALFAVILSLTVSGSALANTINPSNIPSFTSNIPSFKGMEHFQEKFPEATEVNCKVKGQFTEVNFIWNGLRLQAFYDGSGNPVATSRAVAVNNLPLFVQMSLKNEYPDFVVTEAVEFTDADDGLSYYVTAAGRKLTYLLHVSTSGTISVFKKMKQ
jgi:hypothetical protein